MSWMASLLLAVTAVAPVPGSEIVVILDNSGSMVHEYDFDGSTVPANDPERLAVLGAMVVDALDEGSDDKVTVIGFGRSETDRPPSTVGQPDIRSWPYASTYFRKPLEKALEIFEHSERDTKVLIFFTDGLPSDLAGTEQLHEVFDPAQHTDIDVIAIGLFQDNRIREQGSALLKGLVHDPAPSSEDFQAVESPREIVGAFTNGYARAIGSRAETGTLAPGKQQHVDVGKYVSEVMAITVSREPGPPFTASLQGPAGDAPVLGQGDNGCPATVAPPDVCGSPRRHFQVFRSANDPAQRSTWTLSLPRESGKVEFGVILRYDLLAQLTMEDNVPSGVAAPIEARLLFRGQTFDDEDFFSADAFTAHAVADGEQVPLRHVGSGVFRGMWTPRKRTADEEAPVEVVFENTWLYKTDRRLVVVKPPPYELDVATPGQAIDPIPALWRRAGACVALDLTGSRDLEDVDLECDVSDRPLGVQFSCERTDATTMMVCGSTHRWCCKKEGQVQVRVKGPGTASEGTSATVPVRYHVPGAGFLLCRWLIVLLVALVLFATWFIYGWIRPHNFEPTAAVTVAGSVAGMRRAGEQILRELPGGRRGFYRDARLCLNGAGDVLRAPRKAEFVLEAAEGGCTRFRSATGLEYMDRRTHKWKPVPPDDFAEGYRAGVQYRQGDLYLKFSG